MPITLIMDNSHYQRCELVTLKADALDIELLFLPAYSPTSTSSRGFGSWSKRPLTKRYYDGFDYFRHAIDTCLEISTAPPSPNSPLCSSTLFSSSRFPNS